MRMSEQVKRQSQRMVSGINPDDDIALTQREICNVMWL